MGARFRGTSRDRPAKSPLNRSGVVEFRNPLICADFVEIAQRRPGNCMRLAGPPPVGSGNKGARLAEITRGVVEFLRNRHLPRIGWRDFAHRDSSADCVEVNMYPRNRGNPRWFAAQASGWSCSKGRDSWGISRDLAEFSKNATYSGRIGRVSHPSILRSIA